MGTLARLVPAFARLPLYRLMLPASHDSASGFVQPRHFSSGVMRYNVTLPYAALKPVLWLIAPYITAWSKTQYGDLGYQLQEGARAFDMRALYLPPLLGSSASTHRTEQVLMQHGDMWIDYPLADALGQVRQFLERPENASEIVMLRFGETNTNGGGIMAHVFITAMIRQILGPLQVLPPLAYANMALGDLLAMGRGRVIVQYDGGQDVNGDGGSAWRTEHGVFGHTDSQWQSAEPGNPTNRNHHLAQDTPDLLANYLDVFGVDVYQNPPEVRFRQCFLQYDQASVLAGLKHDLPRGKLIPGSSGILSRAESLGVNEAVLGWIQAPTNTERNTLNIVLFDGFTRAVTGPFIALNAMRAGLGREAAQALLTQGGDAFAGLRNVDTRAKNATGATVPLGAPLSVKQGLPTASLWAHFAANGVMSVMTFAPLILLLLAGLWMLLGAMGIVGGVGARNGVRRFNGGSRI
jgi:hypothetical protein